MEWYLPNMITSIESSRILKHNIQQATQPPGGAEIPSDWQTSTIEYDAGNIG